MAIAVYDVIFSDVGSMNINGKIVGIKYTSIHGLRKFEIMVTTSLNSTLIKTAAGPRKAREEHKILWVMKEGGVSNYINVYNKCLKLYRDMLIAQFFPRASLFLVIIPIIFFTITLYLAIWIYRDAERRGQEPALWLLIFLVSNIFGLILWLILRPGKKRYSEDLQERK